MEETVLVLLITWGAPNTEGAYEIVYVLPSVCSIKKLPNR